MLKQAVKIAWSVHKDQVDKIGDPYFLHVVRVALAGETENEKIVGLLHDTIEDTKKEYLSDLYLQFYQHFNKTILDAIEVLSRTDNIDHEHDQSTYTKYIASILHNPLARRVKIHDVEDHLSRSRNLRRRHVRRYKKALKTLKTYFKSTK